MIILVGGEKGGAGKSCLSQNLAVYLQTKNRDVLLLDADPQGNASSGVGVDKEVEESVYDILIGDTEIKDVVIKTNIKNLYLLQKY